MLGGVTCLKLRLPRHWKQFLVMSCDIDFQEWLARKIGLSNSEQLVDLFKYAEDETEHRGRNKLPINVRQDVYDFWKANSNVGVHRSNNRHFVTISADNFESSDIHDEDISLLDNDKVQGHHLVATKPYHRLHEIYCQVSEFQPSFGSFINLKPFYVTSPTNKETEMSLQRIFKSALYLQGNKKLC